MERLHERSGRAGRTLPSSEPEAMIESSKGFLSMGVRVKGYRTRGL